jgi:fatty acid desaturase
MHCVAGDGVGILAGAVIASVMQLAGVWEVELEYVLGFGFGWTIFQALFMRGGWFLWGCIAAHVLPRTAVHERAHGWDAADDDGGDEAYAAGA